MGCRISAFVVLDCFALLAMTALASVFASGNAAWRSTVSVFKLFLRVSRLDRS